MRTLLLFLAVGAIFTSLGARPFPFPAKKLTNFSSPPWLVEEHYQAGMEAVRQQEWVSACQQLEYVRQGYPDSIFAKEALYQLGAAYYQQGALLESNHCFSAYLDRDVSPRHFIEVFQYKLDIAKDWHYGRRKHLLDVRYLPRWQGARQDALDLYDEIFTALPGHPLGCEALFQHAALEFAMGNYREAIEGYQVFLQRFPKHGHAPTSFLSIGQVYLEQAKQEVHNPDLLPLATINVRKFRQEFPTSEQLLEAEEYLGQMREVFATGLAETGHFYQRMKQPVSAAVYYRAVLEEFPRTQAAVNCSDRLALLDPPQEGV